MEKLARKVLIVDDNRDFTDLLLMYFSDIVSSVETSDSISAATSKLCQQPFDMVLADFHLADGKVTELLDATANKKQVKLFLVMTGDASQAETLSARKDIDGVLLKPFDVAEQIERLQNLK